MKLNKFNRFIAMTLLSLALLVLPIFSKVDNIKLYYVGIIILILIIIYRIVYDEKFEQRFYERWQKNRKQGFKINVVREGLRALVFMIMVVGISQFLVNGHTPWEIVLSLASNTSVWIMIVLFLLILSLIIGVVALYENDKRYKRIFYNIKNNN